LSGLDSDAQRHTVTCAAIFSDVEKENSIVNPMHTMNVNDWALHIITSALDRKQALQRPNFNAQQIGVTCGLLCIKSKCCMVRFLLSLEEQSHTFPTYLQLILTSFQSVL
jgi:hypothetical protein